MSTGRLVAVTAAALVVAACAPVVATASTLRDGSEAVLWITVALGLGFAYHRGGIPSLAQGAYVAVGAYAVAIAQVRWGFDPVTACVCVAVAGLIPAVLGGLAVAKLRSPFAALATWLLGWCFVLAIDAFPGVSGGPRGLVLPESRVAFDPLAHTFVLGASFWWWVVVSFATVVIIGLALAARRYGPALRTARADPAQAVALGGSPPTLRVATMAATSWVALVAGGLLVEIRGVADPTEFRMELSYVLLLAVLIGGSTAFGPLLGLAVVAASTLLADAVLPRGATRYDAVISAGVLLVVAVVAPTGLLSRRRSPPRRVAERGEASGVVSPRPSPPTAGVTVALEHVGLELGTRDVLDDVTLSLSAGDCLAVVGLNGSGKTMLARLISGHLRPTRGTIRVPVVRRTLQRPITASALTPRDVLVAATMSTRTTGFLQAITATPLARAEDRLVAQHVDAILEWCGLDPVADASLASLSATSHRVLQIAAAIAGAPAVVVLDEPVAGLDDDGRDTVVALMHSLREQHRSMIVIEHDLSIVGAIADSYVVISDGQVVSRGNTAQMDHDTAVAALRGPSSVA